MKAQPFLITFLSIFINACSQPQADAPQKEAVAVIKSQKDILGIGGGTLSNVGRLKFSTGVRAILEDSKGNVWFGSHQEGVALLQEGEFYYFTEADGLSHNQVRNIYEDAKGRIWFECGQGLSYYDGKRIYTPKDREYASPWPTTISPSDLWFKGDEANGYNLKERKPGVYRYDGKRFFYHEFPIQMEKGEENYYSSTTSYIPSKRGGLWWGSYGAAVGYDGSGFTIIDNDYLELNKETGFLHIRAMMEDSKGNLWIGNNGIGVFSYDGKEVVNFTEKHRLGKGQVKGNSLHRVFSIGEDSAGNIWFGTIESGVWRYNGKELVNFTEKGGLDSRHYWTIYTSKSGELWLGAADPSAVYSFNGTSFDRKF